MYCTDEPSERKQPWENRRAAGGGFSTLLFSRPVCYRMEGALQEQGQHSHLRKEQQAFLTGEGMEIREL